MERPYIEAMLKTLLMKTLRIHSEEFAISFKWVLMKKATTYGISSLNVSLSILVTN